MITGTKVLYLQNYILKKPVPGAILADGQYVQEEIDWILPAGTLVTVYQTDFYWIIEKKSNLLPGTKFNVSFKGFVLKENLDTFTT